MARSAIFARKISAPSFDSAMALSSWHAAACLALVGGAAALGTRPAPRELDRRTLLRVASTAAVCAQTAGAPDPALAAITKDADWPLWLALPVFPYSRRKTIRREIRPGVWAFEQLLGIYYVQVPIRMTVIAMASGGLFVYAPIAPTMECLDLLQPLIEAHGPVKTILLPTVAVEHKVNAGPFARAFPNADFYVTDRQYSFPLPLPDAFLGLPRWTKPLPPSSDGGSVLGPDFDHDVLTVQPGVASMYQDVAVVHKPSRTLLVCDALFSASIEPPPLLTAEPEYVNALLFHARDEPLELVPDTPANRRKGWRRIVLLFNFFIPGAASADVGLAPLRRLDATYPLGWGGWQPFEWREDDEQKAFNVYIAGSAPITYPIVQIILSRGDSGGALRRWVDTVTRWDFDTIVPAHLDAPIAAGPRVFAKTFDYAANTANEARRLCHGSATAPCT